MEIEQEMAEKNACTTKKNNNNNNEEGEREQ